MLDKLLKGLKGGPGSGNFGHSGRPGQVGGSGGGGGRGGGSRGGSEFHASEAKKLHKEHTAIAKYVLGSGKDVRVDYNGFHWSKDGGYAHNKIQKMKGRIIARGFKPVPYNKEDYGDMYYDNVYKNAHGDVFNIREHYGATSASNAFRVNYLPNNWEGISDAVQSGSDFHKPGHKNRGKMDVAAYKKMDSKGKEEALKSHMADYKERYVPKAKWDKKTSKLSAKGKKQWMDMNRKIGEFEGLWRGTANKGWSHKGTTRRKFWHVAVRYQEIASDIAAVRDAIK